uniref:Uncharacterized protein n=1 Tax=Manihot esculenta TaxID=3983 RepID=A0A2C9W8K9_MANES
MCAGIICCPKEEDEKREKCFQSTHSEISPREGPFQLICCISLLKKEIKNHKENSPVPQKLLQL